MTAIACCIASFSYTSCSKDENKPQVNSLKFDKNRIEVVEGGSTTVKVGGGTTPYTAASTDAKIVTAAVDKDVVTVKGVKKGAANITVTDKNKWTGVIAVTVTDKAKKVDAASALKE